MILPRFRRFWGIAFPVILYLLSLEARKKAVFELVRRAPLLTPYSDVTVPGEPALGRAA